MTENGPKDVITSATQLVLGENVALQDLGDEEGGVLLKLDSGEMYTVNETTLAFLQEIDGERSIGDIIERMMAMFDVDQETLSGDVAEIAEELMGESLVVVKP